MNKKNINHVCEEVLNCLCSVFQTRMEAYSNYSNQVWNRFNWLLTLQTGIAGFFLSNFSSSAGSAKGVIFLAIVVCVFWLLLGIEDFYGLRKQSERVQSCQKIIIARLEPFEKGVLELQKENPRFLNFRQTSLLFFLPLVVLIAWLLLMWQV